MNQFGSFGWATLAGERVTALARYGILDTGPEPAFDDIVLLATRICDAPVALVSLVTDDRQWFKARIGFPACETPLSQSVCAHALAQGGVLVIPDLTLDERTRHNALVTGDPNIRFYAGAVLSAADGIPIGALCVIDTMPRPDGLSSAQMESLEALARQVMSQMELKRAVVQRDEALAATKAAYDEFEQQQRLLSDELQHRLKNILSVVHSVVVQTLRRATNFNEARPAIAGRIAALGRAQELLFAREADKAPLKAIVEGTANLYDAELHRFRIAGPDVEIGPRSALALSLIFHEMATNAIKYGALSTPDGHVAIEWHLNDGDENQRVSISWREIGGPPVVPPDHEGFGTRLIERALSGGTVTLKYRPDGFQCDMDAPLCVLEDR